MAALAAVMAEPRRRVELAAEFGGFGDGNGPTVRYAVGLLLLAGFAAECDHLGNSGEDIEEALSDWEFHDLVFHAHSREGRHRRPMGASYHGLAKGPIPGAVKKSTSSFHVQLPAGVLGAGGERELAALDAIGARHSVREFGPRSLSIKELGCLLWHACRVARMAEVPIETPYGEISVELACRPYPSGGGLYELELYLVVLDVKEIPQGVYWYNPVEHRLEHICGKTPEVDLMTEGVRRAMGRPDAKPQVIGVLTARYRRLSWKYSSIAYSLVLKHVGCITQTIYLVATTLRLGCCAIGGGNPDLFSKICGISYYREPSVGEFVIGTNSDAQPECDDIKTHESG
jgi:SagB-type dehydrogenase family enzyme